MIFAHRFRLLPVLSFCVALALSFSEARAQTAGMMSFQGFIKDAGGNPISGTVDLLFDIRSVSTSLVTFTRTGVTATAGVITSKYGPVAPSIFDGSPRLLRVTVTPVSPVGPAFTLADVEIVTPPGVAEQLNALGTGSPALISTATGNVGVGVANPLGRLHLSNDLRIGSNVQMIDGAIGGLNAFHMGNYSGLPLAFHTTGTTPELVLANGAVGMGTVPVSPGQLDIAAPGAQIILRNTVLPSNARSWRMLAGSNSLLAFAAIDDDGTGAVNGIQIARNGGVGIGSGSFTPASRLQVQQSIDSNAGGIAVTNTAVNRSLHMWVDSSSRGRIDCGVTADSAICLNGSGGGYIGIGTAAPTTNLAISSGADTSTSLELANTSSGGKAWRLLSTGANSTTGAGFLRIQNATTPLDAVVISPTGDVGVGTTNPSARLHVVGNICATGTIGACSDGQYKTNVAALNGALDTLAKLRAVRFDWRCAEFPDRKFDNAPQIGFIAQEVLDVVPEVVQQGGDGYYSVDYGRLTPVLTAAIQELNRRHQLDIGKKDAELAVERARIDKLTERLEKLEAALAANGEVRR